jgi:hypothetical protein
MKYIFEILQHTHTHITDIARGRDRFHIKIKNHYNINGEIKWN